MKTSDLINEIKNHFWHYLILVLIILTGGIAFLAHPDRQGKFQIGCLVALSYIGWGIFHHLLENNLKLMIVVEYTLVAILAIVLLGGILL